MEQAALTGSGDYHVDPQASVLSWAAEKKIGGDSRNEGTLSVKEGSLEINNGELVGGSFTIDMTSIAVTSVHEGKDDDQADALIGHLVSDDFFGVETYPEAKLVITSLTKSGNGEYVVTADLTIKGVTEQVVFPAMLGMDSDGHLKATASIEVDRTLYDVRFGSDKFFDNLGDNIINDEFTLDVELTAEPHGDSMEAMEEKDMMEEGDAMEAMEKEEDEGSEE